MPVDQSLNGSGAAFAFARDGAGSWVQEAYIKASNAEIGDAFGHSVATSGDTSVVGAPGEDGAVTGINGDESNNGAPGSGAAYVFVRSSDGNWTQEAYLKPLDTLAGAGFGYTVAIDGDTIAVSAWRQEVGVVYLFTRDANGAWAQEASVVPADDAYDVGFADAIDIEGDTLAVGAPFPPVPSTCSHARRRETGSSKRCFSQATPVTTTISARVSRSMVTSSPWARMPKRARRRASTATEPTIARLKAEQRTYLRGMRMAHGPRVRI